jgi:hypothetical protein
VARVATMIRTEADAERPDVSVTRSVASQMPRSV